MDWMLLQFVSSRRRHTSDRHPKSSHGTTKASSPIHRINFEAIQLRLRIRSAAFPLEPLNKASPMSYVGTATQDTRFRNEILIKLEIILDLPSSSFFHSINFSGVQTIVQIFWERLCNAHLFV